MLDGVKDGGNGRVFSHSSRTDMWMVHKVLLLGASLYLSRLMFVFCSALANHLLHTDSNQLHALEHLRRHHEFSKDRYEDSP